MSLELTGISALFSKRKPAPAEKLDSLAAPQKRPDILAGHTGLKGSQKVEPEKPEEGSRHSAGASPAGITQEKPPPEPPRDVSKDPPSSEKTAAPDRLPANLSPATRKLAEQVVSPPNKWDELSRDMREALLVLSTLEARQADVMPSAVTTAGGEVAIWDYVQQCVDNTMSYGPDVWGPWLDDLSRNPQTAPIVGRVLSMYALNIYLTNSAIRQYIENPGGNTGTLNTEWFRSTHANAYNALKSVGDYIKRNPQQGTLVKGIFNYQLQSFGGLPGRFGILLQECGLI
jgi:hypothetical protein